MCILRNGVRSNHIQIVEDTTGYKKSWNPERELFDRANHESIRQDKYRPLESPRFLVAMLIVY